MQVELTLETVTPLFLGGADQRSELRPASVRGALRFWLRALLGSELGDSMSDLHDEESAVFGNIDYAAPVVLRLEGAMSTMANFDLDRGPQGRQLRNGHNYFYYSTRLGSRVPLAPNSKFALTLRGCF
jgi:CRISPR type III-B/RAMP module RAMP protein Cmr1